MLFWFWLRLWLASRDLLEQVKDGRGQYLLIRLGAPYHIIRVGQGKSKLLLVLDLFQLLQVSFQHRLIWVYLRALFTNLILHDILFAAYLGRYAVG